MTNKETKVFHLGDVLSITTSRLVSPRYMDGVYDLVRYLTGTEPQFDVLTATMVSCRRYIIAIYPELDDLEIVDVAFENWRDWLKEQQAAFGEWIKIRRPEPGELM